mmetsp:Transcript_15448/g.39265  ORF Transcript_15448/g.39265 Transcript_15448/m.39265 type:complete len:219 (-) Transcript_15448:138-794(-)
MAERQRKSRGRAHRSNWKPLEFCKRCSPASPAMTSSNRCQSWRRSGAGTSKGENCGVGMRAATNSGCSKPTWTTPAEHSSSRRMMICSSGAWSTLRISSRNCSMKNSRRGPGTAGMSRRSSNSAAKQTCRASSAACNSSAHGNGRRSWLRLLAVARDLTESAPSSPSSSSPSSSSLPGPPPPRPAAAPSATGAPSALLPPSSSDSCSTGGGWWRLRAI